MTSAQNTYRFWTTGEIAELQKCYYTEPTAELAARLGRTEQAVRNAATKYVEPAGRKRKNLWTPDEEFVLTKLVNRGCSIEQCAEQLSRTCNAVRFRALHLGLSFRTRDWHRWSAQEIEKVRKAATEGKTMRRVAEDLGVGYDAIRGLSSRQNIRFGGESQ